MFDRRTVTAMLSGSMVAPKFALAEVLRQNIRLLR
jgi:hypothetical protein